MQRKYLSTIKNVDFSIYDKLDDLALYNFCLSNKLFSEVCKNEEYFEHRILIYFGRNIIEYKPNNISFKQQYIDIVKFLYKTGLRGG